ncbi:MAG: hypothetical protein CFE21_08865 [Bacteroidetes bacterium B1(2017)]|nr:MAG: hypothetical protein CFE21_08865 [Bacteroidetes bacterium B1(2017)]
MKITHLLTLSLLLLLTACTSNTTQQTAASKDTTQAIAGEESHDRTQYVSLAIGDTIKKSTSYYFSNAKEKDVFLLTIHPGKVRESTSTLQIITAKGQVIYTQTFETFYFVKLILEPDSVPNSGGQEEYDAFVDAYCKAITPTQYERFFYKNLNTFFETIYLIDKSKNADFNSEEDIQDKNFLQEILSDTSLQLIDIACYNCSEGGATIGYSKKQNKVVTLLEHD